MTGVASVRVRRFESKPRAAGCRPGTPSIRPWLSPPTVQTVGERASASNNRLVPERGAPTTNIGRSKRCAVGERRRTLSASTRGAIAAAGGPADGAASSGLRAGRISSCRTLSTASTSLRSQTLPGQRLELRVEPAPESLEGRPALPAGGVPGPEGTPFADPGRQAIPQRPLGRGVAATAIDALQDRVGESRLLRRVHHHREVGPLGLETGPFARAVDDGGGRGASRLRCRRDAPPDRPAPRRRPSRRCRRRGEYGHRRSG